MGRAMPLSKAFSRLNLMQRCSCGLLLAAAVIGLGISARHYWQPQSGRSQTCIAEQKLTAMEVNGSESNGVTFHKSTFVRQIPIPRRKERVPIVVSPEALSADIWQPLPTENLRYLGKGGEGNWHDWLSPDHYYLLNIPKSATALAFSRLCYRNGDVGFDKNNRFEVEPSNSSTDKLSGHTVVINERITIKAPTLPSERSRNFPILVNAGSDKRDALITQTNVYYTTDPVDFPSRF